MGNEIILKKLEQIRWLLQDLEKLLEAPFEKFQKDNVLARAAERNFQLIVDLAIDINALIITEMAGKTPDTYKQSFIELGLNNFLDQDLARLLGESAGLRNILVHEYDLEEDVKKFYKSAKEFIPAYHKYSKAILDYVEKQK